jgi:hypothetical protein
MGLELKQIQYPKNGKPVSESKDIEVPRINDEDFKTRLKEINETYRIIRDSRTGRAFEIAIVNKSRLMNGAILMPSTMFSSLTQNAGNAIELAAHGAAIPDIARVYIAFPGNGGSDNLSRQDRQHLAHTGRFTQKNGQALDSVSALVDALDDNDIPIKSISANVEGGRLGLGIMAALPTNSVTSVYFNGLPGISSSENETFNTAMIKEDHRDQPERMLEVDREEYRVSDLMLQKAKSDLSDVYPKIYSNVRQGIKYGTRLLSTYLRALPNMRAYTKAFGAYDNLHSIDSHAVFQDTLAALKRQENARVTFQFSEFSMLHNREECEVFCQKLTEVLSNTSFQGSIQLFLYAGSLDFHTAFPSRRWAAEKYALMIQ